MAKYFYVTFQGRNNPKEAKEDKFGNIDEDPRDMLKSLSFITGSSIIPSEHFIPNYFMDVIKKETKCEIVSIMSSIEMSEKDMEANSKYLQRVEEQDKLPDMVTDEINKLIGLTQAGNLRVIVDEKSEKIEDEDDLLNPDPDYWKDKK